MCERESERESDFLEYRRTRGVKANESKMQFVEERDKKGSIVAFSYICKYGTYISFTLSHDSSDTFYLLHINFKLSVSFILR